VITGLPVELREQIGRWKRDYPPLSDEEQLAAYHAIQAGDRQAANRLYMSCTPIVFYVLNKYFHRLPTDIQEEAFQEGSVYCLRYARRFDPTRGKATTFFTHSASFFALQFLRSYRSSCRRAIAVSINNDDLPIDVPDTAEIRWFDGEIERLQERLRQLPPRDQAIVEQRLLGFTLAEIGTTLGLTRERVRQIEEQAMDALAGAPEPNRYVKHRCK
jgi:RNA polymerase sigma factor (sigma-70 family)